MKILIVICLRTAQKWLCKLKYKYKNIYKNVFIDKYEQLNVVDNYKIFFKKWINKNFI